jgi:hypothetical protein
MKFYSISLVLWSAATHPAGLSPMALACPQPWHHFVNDSSIQETSRLQLQWSGQVPLSIVLDSDHYGGYWFDHLDILFDVSLHWQDVMLDLSDEDLFCHLLASPCAFPLLKKLAIWSPGSMELLIVDASQFFKRFPALEKLEL